eukprot:TRINITY_DN13673_c0_g1_i3.p1 TRINITY_DN13673_c0_g1~~TRINITY_DN13673_c0_g1_i3.p1  ORF type:complete len:116 (-),score=20.09 TRINITY_DN13673_c0_g1_i3:109-456(-)
MCIRDSINAEYGEIIAIVRTCTPSLAARALWLGVVVGVRILVCTMHTSLALKPSSSFPQGEPPALVGCRRHSDTHFRNTNCSYLLPVSYTHLRAHETPEHLVCRLLLEKKKKEPT